LVGSLFTPGFELQDLISPFYVGSVTLSSDRDCSMVCVVLFYPPLPRLLMVWIRPYFFRRNFRPLNAFEAIVFTCVTTILFLPASEKAPPIYPLIRWVALFAPTDQRSWFPFCTGTSRLPCFSLIVRPLVHSTPILFFFSQV